MKDCARFLIKIKKPKTLRIKALSVRSAQDRCLIRLRFTRSTNREEGNTLAGRAKPINYTAESCTDVYFPKELRGRKSL